MKQAFLVVALLVTTLSCGPQPLSKQELLHFGEKEELSARKAIADNYLRWIEATRTKNVDAVLALYDDEAVVLPDDGNTLKGKEAIRSLYQQWYSGKDKLIKQQFDNTSLQMARLDLAIETADFSGTSSVDGKENSFRGKNLIVWKQQPDGSWKIFRDIWNASPAGVDGSGQK